jgi:transcriptional regulator with XRE-family HTH domain
MNAGSRLKQVRQDLGLTQKDFAEKLGFKWYKIKDMESGKQNITYDIAKLIEKIFSINHDWLLTGEGEMYVKNNSLTTTENKIENAVEINYLPEVYGNW